MEIEIANHQTIIPITDDWIKKLTTHTKLSLPLILQHRKTPCALDALPHIDIAIVDDATSAHTHETFMSIPGATDVITFPHGEIIISAETAHRQAQEYDDTYYNEILRYIIHGLLHLAGLDDLTPADFTHMHQLQEHILSQTITSSIP